MQVIKMSKEDGKGKECQGSLTCLKDSEYKVKLAYHSFRLCKECFGELVAKGRQQINMDTIVKIK